MSRKPPNIAIVGPPGSGKSTVGKRLAQALSMAFVDTDEMLESQFGCTLSEYFAKRGEAAFRTAESAVLARVCERQGVVIATGGGILIDPENRALLKQKCRSFNLKASIEDLLHRQEGTTHRPLLQGGREAKLKSLLTSRKALYDSVKEQVETSGKTIDEVVNEIRIRLEMAIV